MSSNHIKTALHRLFRFTIALMIASTILIFHTQVSLAHLAFDPYIYSGSAIKDPINIIFVVNGTLSNSTWEIGYHFGWTDQGGSTLQFKEHSVTENMQAQRASACLACNRYHNRFNQGNDSGGSFWGTWTMVPVHHDVLRWCGHIADTFDGARDYIISGMVATHSWGYYYLGNSAATQQCDGSWIAGDGWAKYVSI